MKNELALIIVLVGLTIEARLMILLRQSNSHYDFTHLKVLVNNIGIIDMKEISLLEQRLANTEKALIALWALMEDLVPPAYQEDLQ